MPKVTQGASVALTANPQTAQGDAQDSSDLELTIVDANDDVLAGFPVSAPSITHPGFGDYAYTFACPIDLPVQTLRAIWSGTGDTDEGPVYGEDLIVVLAHGTVVVDPGAGIVSLEDALDTLGLTSDAGAQDDRVARLLNAVSAEIRRMTRRGFEGDVTSYDEIVAVADDGYVRLPHVPVFAVTSLAHVHFDGTEDDVYLATRWRVENADTGLVLLFGDYCRHWRSCCHGPRRVRAIWAVTGEITADIEQAALEWIADRWTSRRRGRMTSRSNGVVSESWGPLGPPPPGVGRTIAGYFTSSSGGPI